jgi:hypothetical protein
VVDTEVKVNAEEIGGSDETGGGDRRTGGGLIVMVVQP